jgi:hypothetical protein
MARISLLVPANKLKAVCITRVYLQGDVGNTAMRFANVVASSNQPSLPLVKIFLLPLGSKRNTRSALAA